MTPMLGIMASGISGHLAPLTPVAGYKVWLDAADTGTITQSGGLVSQWTDKSGSAYAFTQATSANQPTTNADTQNGKNVLTWGTNDFLLSTAASSTWIFLHNAQSTVFFAYKSTVNTTEAALLTDDGNTSGSVGFFMAVENNAQFYTQITRGVGGSYVSSNATSNGVLDTNFTYTTVISDATNATAANRQDTRIKQGSAIKNNVQTQAVDNGNPATSLRIGAYAGISNALNGTYGEILIYESILSAGDILLNQQYLAGKWGV